MLSFHSKKYLVYQRIFCPYSILTQGLSLSVYVPIFFEKVLFLSSEMFLLSNANWPMYRVSKKPSVAFKSDMHVYTSVIYSVNSWIPLEYERCPDQRPQHQ